MSDDMISVLAKQSEELIRQDAEIASLRAAVLEICEVAVEKDRQCKVLARENERLRAALEEHKKAKPDWYWRDLDPDDAGDTIGEALRFMPDNVVCAIRSSFVGPTFFAARVPVLDPESDDTEELCADNEADCLLLVKDRLKARAALAGGQHE